MRSKLPYRRSPNLAPRNWLIRKHCIQEFETCVANGLTVSLNDNQYGALASFAFNIACGNLADSAMVDRMNTGDPPNAVATEELTK